MYRAPWELRVSTAVTKVILGRVISHNSSRMDIVEIKSASQTLSWGGNIPVQFFIDLHSISPWQFPPRSAPPSLFLPSIALISKASPCAFDDEQHNIHHLSLWTGGKKNKWENRTLTHPERKKNISTPKIGICQAVGSPAFQKSN